MQARGCTASGRSRNLVPCGQRPGEADELRSFSLFRLALVDAYATAGRHN
ncbi:MAG: hypothetical protein H6643_05585 [Caldilineaceae bacterium]|nr:hypothetical protein [Caldilineaceae bacterium]